MTIVICFGAHRRAIKLALGHRPHSAHQEVLGSFHTFPAQPWSWPSLQGALVLSSAEWYLEAQIWELGVHSAVEVSLSQNVSVARARERAAPFRTADQREFTPWLHQSAPQASLSHILRCAPRLLRPHSLTSMWPLCVCDRPSHHSQACPGAF